MVAELVVLTAVNWADKMAGMSAVWKAENLVENLAVNSAVSLVAHWADW